MTMILELTAKGATYTAECERCGTTNYAHEWADWDPNERRDAMQAGTLRCDCCFYTVDPATFAELKPHYAARYTMPGHLDCTEWEFGTNRRQLIATLRSMYG